MITIPEYYQKYVDPNVDLNKEPLQACPFHKEQHGKSFSYSPSRMIFSCFGACHVIGGDVVALHQLHYKIRTREEAQKSLNRLLGIRDTPKKISFKREEILVNEKEVAFKQVYGLALQCACTPDDWVELDYIMSQYTPSVDALQAYINMRRRT